MAQPGRQERQPAAQQGTPPSRPARYKALAWARDRFEGSLAQSFLQRLKALDFADQAVLFGAGLLVSLLPFVILVVESLAERPVSTAAAGGWLAPLVTVAIMTPFFWWTMHFLLAGRVAWRTLLPSALITGVFYGGLGVFSKFYFSETIISDSKTYGTIGAIFGIMTWFIAIGAVIILGAVAGAAWEDRRNYRSREQRADHHAV
jgi:uncharacterized BrkB/YihY/UPF0761 family membrane protein